MCAICGAFVLISKKTVPSTLGAIEDVVRVNVQNRFIDTKESWMDGGVTQRKQTIAVFFDSKYEHEH